MPEGEPGEKLTFKALQTYDDGQVVRWIGPEDAEEPAPIVTLTEPASGGGHGAPGTADTAATGGARRCPRRPTTTAQDGLSIAALIVGALGLAAGLAALVASRRRAPGDGMRLALATLAIALVAAAPAAAHVGVKSYSPKRGATVSRSLERVKVTFNGRIADGQLTVRNANGTKVSRGERRRRARRPRPARAAQGRARPRPLLGLDAGPAQRRPRDQQVVVLLTQLIARSPTP